ncbi:MAG TPA: phosphatase PAP2 family protein [Candidatus Baltobacteraceae bacterium]|nr:phosphatase PAP2 family protein [Candidatus Baltobacteraceae bacterium]
MLLPFLDINVLAFQFVKAVANPLLSSVLAPLAESFYIVLPLLFVYLYLKRDRNSVLFIGAFILLFVVSEAVKLLVRESRPCTQQELSWINVVGGCESGYGFPSSHATTLTGLVFFLSKYRVVQGLYIIWLVLILFGRVYLGQHYLTDVLAGMAISLAIGYLVYRGRETLNKIIRPILVVIRLER